MDDRNYCSFTADTTSICLADGSGLVMESIQHRASRYTLCWFVQYIHILFGYSTVLTVWNSKTCSNREICLCLGARAGTSNQAGLAARDPQSAKMPFVRGFCRNGRTRRANGTKYPSLCAQSAGRPIQGSLGGAQAPASHIASVRLNVTSPLWRQSNGESSPLNTRTGVG